jgi:two-component system, LytTR family, response regulator
MIKCLIVEDEYAAQQVLKKKLSLFYPQIEVLAALDNKDEAVAFIDANELDLVFLDVQIRGGTGLEVLQSVKNRDFEAVFITAYDGYAIEALNENASYYLMKPIRNTDFQKGMSMIITRINAKTESSLMLVPNKGIQLPVRTDDIIYLESDGAYTSVVTATERYVSSKNLGYYEKMLSGSGFARSHHSFIVNLSKVQAFKKGRSGVLVMKNGMEIPVSQRKMNDFREYFVE